MLAKKLKEALKKEHISYESIKHPETFTTQDTASSIHESGRLFAKPVIVTVDGKLAMAVLAGHTKLDLDALKSRIGATTVELAREEEFKGLFKDCETGAMPPTGNLYGLEVYVDKALTKDKEILFNGGTHKELVKLSYKDFKELVHPEELWISA